MRLGKGRSAFDAPLSKGVAAPLLEPRRHEEGQTDVTMPPSSTPQHNTTQKQQPTIQSPRQQHVTAWHQMTRHRGPMKSSNGTSCFCTDDSTLQLSLEVQQEEHMSLL